MHTPKFNTKHFKKLNELSTALLSLSNAHKLPDSVMSVIQELNDEVETLSTKHLLMQVECADSLARVNGYDSYDDMVSSTGSGFDFEAYSSYLSK